MIPEIVTKDNGIVEITLKPTHAWTKEEAGKISGLLKSLPQSDDVINEREHVFRLHLADTDTGWHWYVYAADPAGGDLRLWVWVVTPECSEFGTMMLSELFRIGTHLIEDTPCTLKDIRKAQPQPC